MHATWPLNPHSRVAVLHRLAVVVVSIALRLALLLRVFTLESFLLLMAIAGTTRFRGLGPGILARLVDASEPNQGAGATLSFSSPAAAHTDVGNGD